MMKKTLLSLAVSSAIASTVFADAQTEALKAQLKELMQRLEKIEKKSAATEEKTDSLLLEMANSKVSDSFGEYTGKTYAGMGPGASKVYVNKNKLSVGGYGKVDYVNYRDKASAANGKTNDLADAYRAVLYFGYRFSDDIILNSEIEFEHGGLDANGNGGEVEIEMLALDFLNNQYANFRVGTYVLPIGLVNVNHEPTLFNSVNRPTTEKNVIPSTWYENGVMAYGSVGDLEYKTGIVAGFDATKSATLRGMRSKGRQSAAADGGYYLRLDYTPSDMLTLSGSYYTGSADQGVTALQGVNINLYEVHAVAKMAGFELSALYAQHDIGSADKLAAFHAKDATKKAMGYYANLNYTMGKWVPFARYEVSNKYDKGIDATGNAFSYSDDRDIVLGLNWKPHPQVVLKADYIIGESGQKNAAAIDNDRFELGMGFVF